MSSPTILRMVPLKALLALLLVVPIASAADNSRWVTYDQDGTTYFALSVSPTAAPPAADGHDVVILFDTSASQTGIYREDGLAAVQELVNRLGDQDRVHLVGVDLQSMPMTDSLISPRDSAASVALARLADRTPLGSTDMLSALRNAAAALPVSAGDPVRAEDPVRAGDGRTRHIVYVGDGISRANLLADAEFHHLIENLTAKEISVSSFAIGPERDIQLLATLANHTGGNLLVDQSDTSPQNAGVQLAATVDADVIWPQSVTFSDKVVESYPQRFPPLRTDRDSILVGRLDTRDARQLTLEGTAHGQRVHYQWALQPEASSNDNAFLAGLVELARRDQGLSLPTVGSEGLLEVRQMLADSAQGLTDLGGQALASGDVAGAERLIHAALHRDPEHPHAQLLQNVIGKDPQLGADRSEPRVAQREDGGPDALFLPPAEVVPENAVIDPANDGRLAAPLEIVGTPSVGGTDKFAPEDELFLNRVEARRAASEGMIKAEVRNTLARSRNTMRGAPDQAINDLKLLREQLRRAPDIDPDLREQLISELESGVRESQRRAVEKAERDAMAAENLAAARERERISLATEQRGNRAKQLMARFNALMDEGRFAKAHELAVATQEMDPRGVVPEIAKLYSHMAGLYRQNIYLRELHDEGFNNTLLEVDRANIAFPDEPPIVYPDPEFWAELTLRRKKYASIDLAQTGSREQRIFEALKETTAMEFDELPLDEAMEFLEEYHQIQIVLDHTAIDDLGLTTSDPVTMNLKGITLRSGLKLLLQDLDLTYVVQDEVLQITSKERAEEQAVTKVYPVADLVLPITSGGVNPFQSGGGLGGGGGGGFGGGGGGGFGGGGGGFGGGGGGFGGGGRGGGGGFFDVEDDLSLEDKSTPAAAAQVAAAQKTTTSADAQSANKARQSASQRHPAAAVISLNESAEKSPAQTWEAYFAEQNLARDTQESTEAEVLEQRLSLQGRVRATVRDLMHRREYQEVVDLLYAALKHGQSQPWMYEAMGLAMQAADAPPEELERALMSAVDFSDNMDQVYYVAKYMAHIGLEQRALSLFREVAQSNPMRPEPYVQALDLAKRLGDQEAIRWSCLGILGQAWPDDQKHIESRALRVAKVTLLEMQRDGETPESREFHKQLNDVLVRDCIARISWTGDADLDILIEEPSGDICSVQNQRTASGGVILGDTFARSTTQTSEHTFSETYVCPEGFSGTYRMLVRRIWGDVTADKVTVEIITHRGTSEEKIIRRQIPLSDRDAMVVFEVESGRRTESLEESQLANVARKHMEVSRVILAQQLGQVASSGAASDLAIARRQALDPRLVPRAGAVGFRPVIQIFPQGSNMSATAVISADRRYVRISPLPLFSGITQVDTFNYVTGEGENVEGGGGGGGGFGGGGGGF